MTANDIYTAVAINVAQQYLARARRLQNCACSRSLMQLLLALLGGVADLLPWYVAIGELHVLGGAREALTRVHACVCNITSDSASFEKFLLILCLSGYVCEMSLSVTGSNPERERSETKSSL